MEKKVVLSRIALLLDTKSIIIKKHGLLLGVYRCCGLDDIYEKFQEYLVPFWYRESKGYTYENNAPEYNVYMGIDCTFRKLIEYDKTDKLIEFLSQLTQAFNLYILSESDEVFDNLANMYRLIGLELKIEDDTICCVPALSTVSVAITETFSIETWLQRTYSDVFASYKSAIDSFIDGNSGATIESCRTTLVGIFTKYQGTEQYAKWMRGIYEVSGESESTTIADLSQAQNSDLKKNDLADFFKENRDGKLTKTKAIYTIYSMMSDYGTHRHEGTNENPTQEDALFMLRLLESILYWVYSSTK